MHFLNLRELLCFHWELWLVTPSAGLYAYDDACFCNIEFTLSMHRNNILKSRHGIADVVHILKHDEPMASDAATQKYLSRLKSKLKKPQQQPGEDGEMNH